MKIKPILFACFLFLAISLSAQHATYLPGNDYQIDEDWLTLSISLDSGMLFGMLYEYVFLDNESDGKFDDMVSRLDWQLNPLVYTGLTMQAEMWDQLVVGLGFWLGIPGPLGSMEDRDWVDPNYPHPYTGTLGIISFSDNVLKEAVFADINVGYKIFEDDILLIIPLLGFNFKHIYMCGRNGYQESPPGTWDTSWFGQEAITYQQNYYIFYLGIQTVWSPLHFLDLQLFASYSPVVFAFNVDKHLLTSYDYVDIPVWGHYVYVDAAINFRIINELSVKLHGSFSWIPIFKGDLYAKDADEDIYILYPSNRGGGSLIMGGINISIVLNL